MSAARASRDAVGSQNVHALRGGREHHLVGGMGVPPSRHSPLGVCVMSPVAGSNSRVCSGSAGLHVLVDTGAPGAAEPAARHVAGVWPDLIWEPVMMKISLVPAPSWPQGQVYTSAPGLVLKPAPGEGSGVALTCATLCVKNAWARVRGRGGGRQRPQRRWLQRQ